jgi:hypothetical protein
MHPDATYTRQPMTLSQTGPTDFHPTVAEDVHDWFAHIKRLTGASSAPVCQDVKSSEVIQSPQRPWLDSLVFAENGSASIIFEFTSFATDEYGCAYPLREPVILREYDHKTARIAI